MKITLYDYLMWVAENESEITPSFLIDQLQIDNMSDDELMKFYQTYKNTELREFKEDCGYGHKNSLDNYYESVRYNPTPYGYNNTITFFIEDKFFEIKEVNGSFLHDNRHLLPPLPKDKMVEWAEDLHKEYVRANNTLEQHIRKTHLSELVEDFGNFVEEYLKSNK